MAPKNTPEQLQEVDAGEAFLNSLQLQENLLTPEQINERLARFIGKPPVEWSIGEPYADSHLRFRPGQLNIFLGHPATGKTTVLAYLKWKLAKMHDLNFCVYTGENDPEELTKTLIEMEAQRSLYESTESQIKKARSFVSKHFTFVNEAKLYTAEELLEIFRETDAEICSIDPHNALRIPQGRNWYQYSYELAQNLRVFCKQTKKTIFLAAHPISEAQRRVHRDGQFKKMLVPPVAADMEGGSTWLNKADNFYIVHRYIHHLELARKNLLWAYKVKYTDTGVGPTMVDNPMAFELLTNNRFEVTKEDLGQPDNIADFLSGEDEKF